MGGEIFLYFPYGSIPEGVQRASGKPPGRTRRCETLQNGKSKKGSFPLPFTRNVFLVRGFSRLRADEVLSPRGKVPKGRRGRPKGACLVAAPGPPVAKLQCAASLAGARPARFTSVPGRAAVAFGAVDPSPGVWAPVDPWSGGKGPRQQEPPGAAPYSGFACRRLRRAARAPYPYRVSRCFSGERERGFSQKSRLSHPVCFAFCGG